MLVSLPVVAVLLVGNVFATAITATNILSLTSGHHWIAATYSVTKLNKQGTNPEPRTLL